MIANPARQRSTNAVPFLLLILAIAMAILLATYVDDASHAVSKHGSEAELVRHYCKDPDFRLWVRPTKRIDVCRLPDGTFGFQVWKRIGGTNEDTFLWSERTAYRNTGVTNLEEFAKLNKLLLEVLK